MESAQRLLSYKQLFYFSLASFGLQAAGAFEVNNASGLFKFLGASDQQVGWLWLIPPATGLIVQPLLGQISDLTDTRFGKRTPFIYAGGLLTCLSLIALSLSESLWLTAMMVLCLSCSINCSTEGLRSLTGDVAPNRQKARAFAWQAVLGSLGATLASVIPWLLSAAHIFIKPEESPYKIPAVLKFSLFLGAVIIFQTNASMTRQIHEKELSPPQAAQPPSRPLEFLARLGSELYRNARDMPAVIRRLFLIQMLTWAGLFCVWIYFGLALAQSIYGLPPGADVASNMHYQALLTRGVIGAGICFAVYQLVGVVYVLLLPPLADRFNPDRVHAFSLLAGSVALIAMLFLHDMWSVYVAMIGLGIFVGSLNTLPYAIVSAEIPPRKMGACLGIFNITITTPQILCGLIIGPLNKALFANHAMYTIALAGMLVGVAGLLLLRQSGLDVFGGLFRLLPRIAGVSKRSADAPAGRQ